MFEVVVCPTEFVARYESYAEAIRSAGYTFSYRLGGMAGMVRVPWCLRVIVVCAQDVVAEFSANVEKLHDDADGVIPEARRPQP